MRNTALLPAQETGPARRHPADHRLHGRLHPVPVRRRIRRITMVLHLWVEETLDGEWMD